MWAYRGGSNTLLWEEDAPVVEKALVLSPKVVVQAIN